MARMTRGALLMVPAALVLAACEPVPVDPERAAQLCEERAQAAQGPTGSVTIGASSEDGLFSGAEIGLSGDFLTGRDPQEVYRECVIARTGALPIRPPRLRS
jgi:hypothetical protein